MDLKSLYILEKKKLVNVFLFVGLTIAYMGSLHPWFMWPLGSYYIVPAAFFSGLALLLSATMEKPVLTRNDYLPSMFVYLLLSFYLLLVNQGNFFGYVSVFFYSVVFVALFKIPQDSLLKLMTVLCKVMAVLLAVSMPFYLLYVSGFPLPSVNAQFQDGYYTFSNYFFFLIDDRSIMKIIPRFQSVFLEPGHLGTATVLLLMTQCGRWKRWYNVILLVATLMSFSLAAYVLLVFIIFLHLWMKRKHFVSKLLMVLALLVGIAVGSFFYNDGDNLLHDLIMIRLEVEDGEMEGNNRVSDYFAAEYEDFLQSSDVFLGRDMDKGIFGNSGYKVYIYENGLVGLLLVIIFYAVSMARYCDIRALITSCIIAVLAFIVRGYPLWYNYYIPFFCLACAVMADNPLVNKPEKGYGKDKAD